MGLKNSNKLFRYKPPKEAKKQLFATCISKKVAEYYNKKY